MRQLSVLGSDGRKMMGGKCGGANASDQVPSPVAGRKCRAPSYGETCFMPDSQAVRDQLSGIFRPTPVSWPDRARPKLLDTLPCRPL